MPYIHILLYGGTDKEAVFTSLPNHCPKKLVAALLLGLLYALLAKDGTFKLFRQPDSNDGLSGNTQSCRLFIERSNHPFGEINIHSSGRLLGTPNIRQVEEGANAQRLLQQV
jgi:hypothetical protein